MPPIVFVGAENETVPDREFSLKLAINPVTAAGRLGSSAGDATYIPANSSSPSMLYSKVAEASFVSTE